MQAEYYSDKSIAVFGETKPWASNLRALGGKFNANLKGRPGWIFQRNKEAELMQFIAQAQQGLIQPTATATVATQTNYPIATPQLAPFGKTQPALTPQAAMARLTTGQPQVLTPKVTIPFPQVALPQIQPVVTTPKPLSPKPTTILPTQPVTIGFPNMFTAADGLTYQIIIYTAPAPTVGQRVTLTFGDNALNYIVREIQNQNAPIDDILISQVLPEIEQGTEAPLSRAIIMNGKWQVHCMQDEHTLTFHPLNQ